MAFIIIVFPIIFLLNLSPIINQVLTAISFFVSIIVTIFVIFVPKIIHLLSGKDIDANLAYKTVKPKKPENNKIHHADTNENLVSASNSVAAAIDPIEMEVKAAKILHGLSNFERLRVCGNQIDMWNNMLLKIGDGSYNSSHHSSHGGGVGGGDRERSMYQSEIGLPGQINRVSSASMNHGTMTRNKSEDNSLANLNMNYAGLGRMTPLELIQEEEGERTHGINFVNKVQEIMKPKSDEFV